MCCLFPATRVQMAVPVAVATKFLSPEEVDLKFAEIQKQQAKEAEGNKAEEDKKRKEQRAIEMAKSPYERHPLQWKDPEYRAAWRRIKEDYERIFGVQVPGHSIRFPTRFAYEEWLHERAAYRVKGIDIDIDWDL